ncbi:zinc finger protein 551-like [Anopheles ziemanni]|nr:zinc finger protein 551-like [Anopheles ziemanni]
MLEESENERQDEQLETGENCIVDHEDEVQHLEMYEDDEEDNELYQELEKEIISNDRNKGEIDESENILLLVNEHAESVEHLSDEQKQMFLTAANAKIKDWVHRGVRRIPVVECTFCNKTYRGRNTLRKHLKLHFNIKNYNCRHCTRSFSDRSSLRLHEIRHSAVKSFNCEHCERSYYSLSELKQHYVLQHEERKFACTICLAKFPLKSILNDHSLVHKPERPYVCNICGCSFKRNRNLVRHLTNHNDGNVRQKVNSCLLRKPISCWHCSLFFEIPSELLNHIVVQHPEKYEQTKKGRHCCPYCNFLFESLDKCLMHQNKHFVLPVNTTGGKIYECGECGRQLRYKSLAQKHLLSHNTKKVFECPYEGCGKKYKHKIFYSRHMRDVHNSAIE